MCSQLKAFLKSESIRPQPGVAIKGVPRCRVKASVSEKEANHVGTGPLYMNASAEMDKDRVFV